MGMSGDMKVCVSLYNYSEEVLSALRGSEAYQALDAEVKKVSGSVTTLFVDGNSAQGRPGLPALHVEFFRNADDAEQLIESWKRFSRWLSQFQAAAPVFIREIQSGVVNHAVSRRGMSKSLADTFAMLSEEDCLMLRMLVGKGPDGRVCNAGNTFRDANEVDPFYNAHGYATADKPK